MRLVLFFFLFAAQLSFAQSKLHGKWKPIFNGKDLKNWDIKITGHPLNDNFANTFRVVDGKLQVGYCLLYTSPSPRDGLLSRMPSSA